ncbi:MAG: hypothetical protein R3330_06225 [Saprospiraceae bacterium]|nr:hypothetical protein [Saprospiraceae bacterium]
MWRSFPIIALLAISVPGQAQNNLQGAWQSGDGVLIIAAGHFSFAGYDDAAFHGTYGGSFHIFEDQSALSYEFNTFDKTLVGQIREFPIKASGDVLTWGTDTFERIDDGSPGALAGAWLITGRMRDGELQSRTPGARKTMKILSGTRFQWIAYNSETGEFSGTGGGNYTTHDGTYTEHIAFFSRDQTRVGASLPFQFELIDGAWHHQGNSSRGTPIHEVWSQRPPPH